MTKPVVKKAVKKVAAKKPAVVTMTIKQAQNLQAFAAKNKKEFKFLGAKIEAALKA